MKSYSTATLPKLYLVSQKRQADVYQIIVRPIHHFTMILRGLPPSTEELVLVSLATKRTTRVKQTHIVQIIEHEKPLLLATNTTYNN